MEEALDAETFELGTGRFSESPGDPIVASRQPIVLGVGFNEEPNIPIMDTSSNPSIGSSPLPTPRCNLRLQPSIYLGDPMEPGTITQWPHRDVGPIELVTGRFSESPGDPRRPIVVDVEEAYILMTRRWGHRDVGQLLTGRHPIVVDVEEAYIPMTAVHNQNIRQWGHWDVGQLLTGRRPIVVDVEEAYIPMTAVHNHHWDVGQLLTGRFSESPGDPRPPIIVDMEEAYMATSSNPRSAVHNHQNITQSHPGWVAGTSQLDARISSDSLTDPIVASREEPQADFNSNMEANNATGSHNQNVTQGSPNSTRVKERRFSETILAIISQTALTMLTIRTNGGSTSFSQNQKILFCLAVAFNLIGFLSFLFAILVRGSQRPGIARIVTGTGFICTAYAFIGIMGMLLKDNIMLWVTGLAGVALIPVFASAFVK